MTKHAAIRTGFMAIALFAIQATSFAHVDPAGCTQVGVSVIVTTFRSDGVTALTGSALACETINYRVTVQKPGGSTVCAFEGGSLTLTTPDGVVHSISTSVPCLGGTSAGCTGTSFVSSLIAYPIDAADVSGGNITATANYTSGIAHDGSHALVSASTPRVTPVVVCDDANPCTDDFCDPVLFLCTQIPKSCNDGNLCTTDLCSTVLGGCVNLPTLCIDDGNPCTIDACNPTTGECQTTPVDCDDDDACTFEACDPIGGCGYAPTLCEDFDTCTLDACNSATGQCVFTPIGGCDGATGSVGAGGSVSTDDESDGASPTDPVETTVTVPGPGFVTITETAITMGAPAGFTLFGQQVVISGPSGTAANPLVIVFRLDASILPPGTAPEDIDIFRNGVFVPDCTGAPGVASPDPCVASRVLHDDDGDVEMTILTSSASDWNFAALSQQNRSIAAKKLTIVQDEATKGKSKLIFTAKDETPLLIAKGAAGTPADLTGTFELFYTDVPANAGHFAMPPAGWKTNSVKQAKYTNKLAPGGPAESTTTGQGVKVAVVKPGKTAKLTAKSRGEDAAKIDLLAGAPGANGITAVLTIENAADGFTYRMCTRFPNDTNQIVVKDISDATGRKLTAKDGIPTPCPARRGGAPTAPTP